MDPYETALQWVESQANSMNLLLESWANINSGSLNCAGLAVMMETLRKAFSPLGGEVSEIELPHYTKINSKGQLVEVPLGKALHITKNPDAKTRVLLSGHMDTVYPVDSVFQKTRKEDENTLVGPGVIDMKGGLVIMLKALEAFENSRLATQIGWEVIISPDEEIGSAGSASILKECAKRTHVGLIFEPGTPDGGFINQRKGASNFTIIARGKSAHVGRDFEQGRSAIFALADLITKAEKLNDSERGIILNVGEIEGGTAVNIVPDLAICRITVRIAQPEDFTYVKEELGKLVHSKIDGITFAMHQHTERPPKIFDKKTQNLFYAFRELSKILGKDMQWKSSGGVTDGNLLAAEGLVTIDSLGAIGGNMHTHEEYIKLNSLVERCSLTTLFLLKLANQEIYL